VKTSRWFNFDGYHLALGVFCGVALLYLLLPILIVIITSFTSGNYISFPPKLPLTWKWYEAFFGSDRYFSAFLNSLLVGGLTMMLALVVGLMAALGYSHRRFRGRTFVYYLILTPFLMPGIILGISLLMSLGSLGAQGSYWVLVVAHCLWAAPLVFLIMVAVLEGVDPALKDTAMNLGAGPLRAFFEITLPLTKAGVISSALLAFVISFHEFVMALFLSAPSTKTLPVVIWTSLRFEVRPVIAAIDTIMVLTVVLTLLIVSKLIGIEKIRIG